MPAPVRRRIGAGGPVSLALPQGGPDYAGRARSAAGRVDLTKPYIATLRPCDLASCSEFREQFARRARARIKD